MTPPSLPTISSPRPGAPGKVFDQVNYLQAQMVALLERETPVTQPELDKLVASMEAFTQRLANESARQAKLVEAKVQELNRFSEANLAKQLAAPLAAQLPTPASLQQAGQQMAKAIREAGEAATRQVRDSSLAIANEVTQPLRAAMQEAKVIIAEYRQVIAAAPTSMRIDFFRAKKDVAIVMAMGGAIALALTWVPYAWLGNSRVPLDEYKDLEQRYQKLAASHVWNADRLDWYRAGYAQLRAANPAVAHRYFPADDDVVPAGKIKSAKPAGPRHHAKK